MLTDERKAALRDKCIEDYEKEYDFPWQGKSHMSDCIDNMLDESDEMKLTDEQIKQITNGALKRAHTFEEISWSSCFDWAIREALRLAEQNAGCKPCQHEWYQGACAHCELPAREWHKQNAAGRGNRIAGADVSPELDYDKVPMGPVGATYGLLGMPTRDTPDGSKKETTRNVSDPAPAAPDADQPKGGDAIDTRSPKPGNAVTGGAHPPNAPDDMPPEPKLTFDHYVDKHKYDALRAYAVRQQNRAEAAEKDAARYRWLRVQNMKAEGRIMCGIWIAGGTPTNPDDAWPWPNEADAAIDRAMATTTPPK